MRANHLIESLINISQSSKTDFALFMNMSPSGLSKILTGNRLPLQKEKRTFYQQAAAYFSKALWAPNCYAKLTDIFPVIYDFSSIQELEQFLIQALKYTLDIEYAAENNVNLDFPDREECFLGPRLSLNMICILLSDHINSASGGPLELYINFPLFSDSSPDLLGRLIFANLSRDCSLSFHCFINSSYMNSDQSVMGFPFLQTAVKMQEYGDLYFWTANWNNNQPFLLLKGRFLLVFTTLIDGSQTMTMIAHKSFLASFFTSLMRQGPKRVSFSGAEASAGLQARPDLIDGLIRKGVQAAYIFMPLGFLLKGEDLDAQHAPDFRRHEAAKLFDHILKSSIPLYITQDMMEHFYKTGRLILPLAGIVNISRSKRLPYLSRLSAHLGNRDADLVILLNSNMPKLAILQCREYTVLYVADSRCRNEKFHVLPTEAIQRGLNRELASGRLSPLPLDEEMWGTLLQELRALG